MRRLGLGVACVGGGVLLVLWWRRRRQPVLNELKASAPAAPPAAAPAAAPPEAPPAPVAAEAANEDQSDVISRAKVHLKFGNVCARSGKPEKALEHYTTAIQLRPSYAAAHHNAGGVCQRLKRFEEAVTHYEAALRIKPMLVEAASNLAVAHLNCRQPAAALEWCRRAIELQAAAGDGLNTEAFHHLNVALRLLGRKREAIEESWRVIGEEERKRSLLEPTPSHFRRPAAVEVPDAPPPHECPALLTLVCVKWGSKYGADYVNKLLRGVRRHEAPGNALPLSAPW